MLIKIFLKTKSSNNREGYCSYWWSAMPRFFWCSIAASGLVNPDLSINRPVHCVHSSHGDWFQVAVHDWLNSSISLVLTIGDAFWTFHTVNKGLAWQQVACLYQIAHWMFVLFSVTSRISTSTYVLWPVANPYTTFGLITPYYIYSITHAWYWILKKIHC